MSDYNKRPLWKKLGYSADNIAYTINAPEDYLELLGKGLGDIKINQIPDLNSFDLVHIFCEDIGELHDELQHAKELIKKNGALWVSWPKKSSGVLSDLNSSYIRNSGLEIGLVDTKVCSIDDKWSALKFVYRLSDR